MRSARWLGLQCGMCEYAVLSPDTDEGLLELMFLHMTKEHPGQRWRDGQGVMHG